MALSRSNLNFKTSPSGLLVPSTVDDPALEAVDVTLELAGPADTTKFLRGDNPPTWAVPPTTDIAAVTHAATSKTTPVDADELPLVDSAASFVLKKLTWLNLKATLKTYFDTLYTAAGGGYATVQDEGTPLTARTVIDFAGAGVTASDDAGNSRTLVTIPGTGAGASVLLYDFTITGSDQASIDTNVDGTTVANFAGYNILEIFVVSRTDDAGAVALVDIILNNDTSSIYDRQNVTGANVSASAAVGNAEASWRLGTHGSGGSASYPGVNRLTIPAYASTTFWKVAEDTVSVPDATATNQNAGVRALGYRSTAAITRVKAAAEGTAKLKVGSRLLVFAR